MNYKSNFNHAVRCGICPFKLTIILFDKNSLIYDPR